MIDQIDVYMYMHRYHRYLLICIRMHVRLFFDSQTHEGNGENKQSVVWDFWNKCALEFGHVTPSGCSQHCVLASLYLMMPSSHPSALTKYPYSFIPLSIKHKSIQDQIFVPSFFFFFVSTFTNFKENFAECLPRQLLSFGPQTLLHLDSIFPY